jgi:SAM-dependent methyltransferase
MSAFDITDAAAQLCGGARPDLDALYAGSPPWEIGRPQPVFAALAQAGVIRGRVLDVGCGTGEHVLLCAGLGLDATGVDLAVTALQAGRRKADERGLPARFLCHDARRLAELADAGESFDTVLDCLVFHALTAADRGAYLDGVRSVLVPGGRFVMLCYSDRQPGDWLPHRLGRDEVIVAFSNSTGWRVDAVDPATAETAIDPPQVAAWLATATRL